jgi:hypothetical protein
MRHRRVRGADDDTPMPGHGEEHAPVVRLRDHDGRITRQKLARQHQMHALARRDDVFGFLIVHAPHVIDKDASGVDHAAGANLVLPACFDAFGLQADDVAVFLHQTPAARVIEQDAAVVHRRAGEVDGETCVIELPVVINHPAIEPLRLQRGQLLDDFLPREIPRGLQPELPGQRVIHLQPDAVKRPLPPVVARNDKRQAVDEMRRVFAEQTALTQAPPAPARHSPASNSARRHAPASCCGWRCLWQSPTAPPAPPNAPVMPHPPPRRVPWPRRR